VSQGLDRLWAGWRAEYVSAAPADGEEGEGCVLCRVVKAESYVVWRGTRCAAVLNAYPYASGHLMVLPLRHVGELEDMDTDEALELWAVVRSGVRAVKAAYGPEGINLGANLGRAAGAGVPGHLHLHVLPRWVGDTNFMTSVAEVRVVPESLPVTYDRLRATWPA